MGYSDVETPKTGDIVKQGMYVCLKRQENGIENPYIVAIAKDDDKLPSCKHCGFTYWLKI